jgi:putative two-component system response regulator
LSTDLLTSISPLLTSIHLTDSPSSILETLEDAETSLLRQHEPASYRSFTALLDRLRSPLPPDQALPASDSALRLCQKLYAYGRSFDALPFALAVSSQASFHDNAMLRRRASTACGLLLADTSDFAGAVECHTGALRIAASAGDFVEMCRAWNNIGVAFMPTGHFSLAAGCFRRSLAQIEKVTGPVYGRFGAQANLANCYFHLNDIDAGLEAASLASNALTPGFVEIDPYGVILHKRNFVRLLVSKGRFADANIQVAEAEVLARKAGTPRASIAAAIARVTYELGLGETDVGLTRLSRALTESRLVPATLLDTLLCIIRAEASAGYPERALARMHELSDLVYRSAIQKARAHIELCGLDYGSMERGSELHSRMKLAETICGPSAPPEWPLLTRLAVGASLREDNTGWHGMRVGVLTRMLAMARGFSSIESLEIGLAAQLHDIGMLGVPERATIGHQIAENIDRAKIQTHCDAGADILSDDRHPRILMARDIARYHHAWWDGSGYPSHVSGKAIPVTARMCAVADVFDTAMAGGPNQSAMALIEALNEVRALAGTRLDPELVNCFDSLMRREMANQGINALDATGLEGFQQLIGTLSTDRGFL